MRRVDTGAGERDRDCTRVGGSALAHEQPDRDFTIAFSASIDPEQSLGARDLDSFAVV